MKIKQINEQGNVSTKTALLDFWKGFISYNGRTTPKGFWIGVIEYLVVILLNNFIFGSLSEIYAGGISGMILSCILYGILIVMQISLAALAFRRLRDAGMKTLPIALLVILNFALSICLAIYPLIVVRVASLVCQIFMVILFCIPSGKISK